MGDDDHMEIRIPFEGSAEPVVRFTEGQREANLKRWIDAYNGSRNGDSDSVDPDRDPIDSVVGQPLTLGLDWSASPMFRPAEDVPDAEADARHAMRATEDPGQECEHTVVVALTFKSYGNNLNVQHAIDELRRWVSVEKNTDVLVAGFAFTDHGSIITRNGTQDLREMAEHFDLF